MGVKYDWLEERIRGLGSQGYRGRVGETLVKYFTAVRLKEKTSIDDLVR